MGTHPIFESDFDCLTECLGLNMRKGENQLDLEAGAVDIKTKPEQWFRDIPEIPVKMVNNEVSLTACLDLRWGRASYGGFNKKLEELARRMNSKHHSDDENEEEDEFGVAERLKLIREGKYKTEYLSDSSDSEIESFEEKGKKRKTSPAVSRDDSSKFMRP